MAEAQAKVAALLAELHAVRDAAAFDADAVETQISALLPRPTVIVPLPPANRDAVQQAIEIAERICASAAVPFSDRKSTRLSSSHSCAPRMPSSALIKITLLKRFIVYRSYLDVI